MSTPPMFLLAHNSPKSVEIAHKIKVEFGVDVRLYSAVKNLPIAELAKCKKITQAELAIIGKIILGHAPKAAAKALHISGRTINLRLQDLRERFGSATNEALVAKLFRYGILK